MVVSSTTSYACIELLMLPLIKVKNNNATIFNLKNTCIAGNNNINRTSNYVTALRRKGCRRFIVKSSEEGSETTTTTTTTTEETWEGEESSAMEVPKGPPSIISALNVQKALRGIAITDVDHYARLGLPRGCSFNQVRAAYENKVKEISSQGLDDEETLNKELELLKESYKILSSEEERRLYDWSLARSEGPDRYMWPFEVDITQTPKGTPPPREPEDVGPTIAVGYFTLGWFILACVLSIAFNL